MTATITPTGIIATMISLLAAPSPICPPTPHPLLTSSSVLVPTNAAMIEPALDPATTRGRRPA